MTNLTKQLAEYKTEPHWVDCCGHGGYLFSFTSFYKTGLDKRKYVEEKIDVYYWENGEVQEFCLRFGAEDSEYRSPGPIANLIVSAQHEPYYMCVKLLQLHGKIVFEINK